jgi:hypothetical protein
MKINIQKRLTSAEKTSFSLVIIGKSKRIRGFYGLFTSTTPTIYPSFISNRKLFYPNFV